MKGNLCGGNRHLWLKCLRGHAVDLDFSVDNYNDHNAITLLNIKKWVDNTFEYEGGVGHVTEGSFHANLKTQLKMKRYALKKLMVAGKEKPKHIRQDHWVNLSALIADEKKVKQAETLTQNRAQLRRLSHAGRSEGEVMANLVNVILSYVLALYMLTIWRSSTEVYNRFPGKPLSSGPSI